MVLSQATCYQVSAECLNCIKLAEIEALLAKHFVEVKIPHVPTNCPNRDTLPESAKNMRREKVLTDYNRGVKRNATKL